MPAPPVAPPVAPPPPPPPAAGASPRTCWAARSRGATPSRRRRLQNLAPIRPPPPAAPVCMPRPALRTARILRAQAPPPPPAAPEDPDAAFRVLEMLEARGSA